MNKCEFCKKSFSSLSAINYHKKTTKYCLKLQGKLEEVETTYTCEFCEKEFITKPHLTKHLNVCKNKESKEKEAAIEALLKEKDEEIEALIIEKEILKKNTDNIIEM